MSRIFRFITLAGLTSFFITLDAHADCITVNSGQWSDTNTWNCTSSGIPTAADNVVIDATHNVVLDVDSAITSLSVNATGDLDIGAAAGGRQLDLSTTSDLSSADIGLSGDLTITTTTPGSLLTLGPVNGAFSVNLDVASDVSLSSLVGDTTPLTSLDVMAGGTMTVVTNINTSGDQTYSGDVQLGGNVSLTAANVAFNGSLNADDMANNRTLAVTGNAFFGDGDAGDTVGGTQPLASLTVIGDTTFNIAAATDVQVIGNQIYEGMTTLSSDTRLSSPGNGGITLNDISGTQFELAVNTEGVTLLRPPPGTNTATMDIGRFTSSAISTVRMRNFTTLRVNSDTASEFNGVLEIGPSCNCVIEQTGTGDIVFNASIVRVSGSPQHLTINDVSGQTIFNNTVQAGQLITNDGTGNDQTVINTDTFQTFRAGANSGIMMFNDPVEITTDTALTETGGGQIAINNTLNINTHTVTISTESTDGVANDTISGSGTLIKTGSGDFSLMGNNAYTGATTINNGGLFIDGSTVAASAVTANGGLLGGNGVINGPSVINNATLAPGANGTGRLDTTDVLLDANATFVPEIDGTIAATEYDVLFVTGEITLAGSLLNLAGSYVPDGEGATFTLVDNDGADAIVGTFANLAEDALAFLPAGPMRITYVGGDGNDLVLIDDEAVFMDGFESP